MDPFGSTLATWSWDFGDPSSGAANTSTLQNPTHNYLTPGFYVVTFTVTSSTGCTQTITRVLEVPRVDALSVVNDSVCTGESANLYAYGDYPGTTITWYEGMGGTIPLSTGNAYATPPLSTTTIYYVSLTEDATGCESALIPVEAHVFSIPSVDITLSSSAVEVPNAIVEFTTSPFGMTQVATYFWQFGDGNSSTSANPVHQWQSPGQYLVTLHISDVHGCTHSFETTVVVNENIRLFVPNAFTPDGGDLNEHFSVVSSLIVDLHVEIYDRWGKLVYASDDLSFKWDGRDAKGDSCPEGSYSYVLR